MPIDHLGHLVVVVTPQLVPTVALPATILIEAVAIAVRLGLDVDGRCRW